jgi:hypothetical protein
MEGQALELAASAPPVVCARAVSAVCTVVAADIANY